MNRSTIHLNASPLLITPNDSEWPPQLSDLAAPPPSIRVAGKLPNLNSAIAIVGTRYADEEAIQFTHELAAQLSISGHVIVSGGAYGIDAAAHEGALSVNGQTIAILATGLRKAYPPRHGPLFERIVRNGALITESPDHIHPKPGLFLKRNRLIAALTHTVIITQAPYRSGALSTAGWAKKLKKTIFAVPSSPWDVRGSGCLKLIQQGAYVCTTAQDVLSIYTDIHTHKQGCSRKNVKCEQILNYFDDDEKKVLKSLNRIPRHPDNVSQKSGLPIPVVQQLLLKLTLEGAVQECSGGNYTKNTVEITDGYGKKIDNCVKEKEESHGRKGEEENRGQDFSNEKEKFKKQNHSQEEGFSKDKFGKEYR